MKVDGTGKTAGPKGPTKTGAKGGGRTGGASFSGLLSGVDDVAAQNALGGVAGVGALDALLSVQAAESADENVRRAKARGVELLDSLDQIRLDLLMGGVPQYRLDNLRAMVERQRETVDDPKLRAVLDEIELRVHVELAKFAQS